MCVCVREWRSARKVKEFDQAKAEVWEKIFLKKVSSLIKKESSKNGNSRYKDGSARVYLEGDSSK